MRAARRKLAVDINRRQSFERLGLVLSNSTCAAANQLDFLADASHRFVLHQQFPQHLPSKAADATMCSGRSALRAAAPAAGSWRCSQHPLCVRRVLGLLRPLHRAVARVRRGGLRTRRVRGDRSHRSLHAVFHEVVAFPSTRRWYELISRSRRRGEFSASSSSSSAKSPWQNHARLRSDAVVGYRWRIGADATPSAARDFTGTARVPSTAAGSVQALRGARSR